MGRRFQCWYSTADPQLVINSLDLELVQVSLLYSTLIPAGLFLLSSCYLAIIYVFVQRREPEPVSDSVVLTASEMVLDTTSQTSTLTLNVETDNRKR